MPADRALLASLLLALASPAAAVPPGGTDAWLDETRGRWEGVARSVWGFHETALQERQSAALLADLLEKEGFEVRRGL